MDGFLPRSTSKHRARPSSAYQPRTAGQPVTASRVVSSQISVQGVGDEQQSTSQLIPAETPHLLPTGKTTLKQKIAQHKKWFFVATVLTVLLGSAAAYLLRRSPTPSPVSNQAIVEEPSSPTPEPTPELVASPLTGLLVSPELANRPVTSVMIENSLDARPQSGLHKAGVIFEAIAEGGITRFNVLFQEGQPDYIGPVRSIRPYYVDWAAGFDAAIAHVGGSIDGKERVAEYGKDLDQFVGGKYFDRIRERFAPHNVYTSSAKLDAFSAEKGYTKSSFTAWKRAAGTPITPPKAASIDLNISGFNFNPHYDYDATCNCYKRTIANKPDIDEKSGTQLAPSVVIALHIPSKIVSTSDGSRYSYDLIGNGTATIFQNGDVIDAKWSKSSLKQNIIFTDTAGTPIPLTTGQVWVSAVSAASKVTYR